MGAVNSEQVWDDVVLLKQFRLFIMDITFEPEPRILEPADFQKPLDKEDHATKSRKNRTVPMTSVPPKTVQKILGHAKLETTMRYYVGVKDRDLRDAISRLEAQTA